MSRIRSFTSLECLMTYVCECSQRSWEIYFKQRLLNIPIPARAGLDFPLKPFLHGSNFKRTFARDNEIERLETFIKTRIIKTSHEAILHKISPAIIALFLPDETGDKFIDPSASKDIAQDIEQIQGKISDILTLADNLKTNNTFNYIATKSSNYSIHETDQVLSSLFKERSRNRKHEKLIDVFCDLPILMPWHNGEPLIASLQRLAGEVKSFKYPAKDEDNFKNSVLRIYNIFHVALREENSKSMRPLEELPFQRDEMYGVLNEKDPGNKESHLAICLTMQLLELFRFDTSSIHKTAMKIINTKIKRNDGFDNLKPIEINYDLFESQERFKAFQEIPCFTVSDSLSSKIKDVFQHMRRLPPQSIKDLEETKKEIDKIVESSEGEVFKRIELFVHNPALTVSGLRAALLDDDTLKGTILSIEK